MRWWRGVVDCWQPIELELRGWTRGSKSKSSTYAASQLPVLGRRLNNAERSWTVEVGHALPVFTFLPLPPSVRKRPKDNGPDADRISQLHNVACFARFGDAEEEEEDRKLDRRGIGRTKRPLRRETAELDRARRACMSARFSWSEEARRAMPGYLELGELMNKSR